MSASAPTSYRFYAKRGARVETTVTVTSWSADTRPWVSVCITGPSSSGKEALLAVGGVINNGLPGSKSKTLKADVLTTGWHYVTLDVGGATSSYHYPFKIAINLSTGGGPTTTNPPGSGIFSDVSTSHPYYQAILGVHNEGIISGYITDGTPAFRPENKVTRAQFAKMICGVMSVEVNEAMTSPFTDLGPDLPDLYPHEYVAAAYAAGITKGKTATTFAPTMNITRAQLITMAVRALADAAPSVLLQTPPSSFACSVRNLDSTHGPNVKVAEFNGLLDGITGLSSGWSAQTAATRGEAAQILWRAMGKL